MKQTEEKKRYKQFKKGKLWVTAPVTFLVIGGTLAPSIGGIAQTLESAANTKPNVAVSTTSTSSSSKAQASSSSLVSTTVQATSEVKTKSQVQEPNLTPTSEKAVSTVEESKLAESTSEVSTTEAPELSDADKESKDRMEESNRLLFDSMKKSLTRNLDFYNENADSFKKSLNMEKDEWSYNNTLDIVENSLKTSKSRLDNLNEAIRLSEKNGWWGVPEFKSLIPVCNDLISKYQALLDGRAVPKPVPTSSSTSEPTAPTSSSTSEPT
ncbi:KxYKxGKxW signal peptide domain-containing protein, partial [Floricoccus tropicus]|uniref:KxYKxGKxW signal peptide domain-containing protein n=1 Tax=Floricoccus tropicus TaxID=1859473 RepID=UPI0013013E73